MSYSAILKIPDIAENQNNKYITHNNAIAYLEQAMHAKLSKSTAGTAAINLTETECTRYRYYAISGGTGNFDVVFLGEIDVNNANREFVVSNDSSYTITVKSDAAGTTVTLTTGQKAIIRQDHDDMTAIMKFTAAAAYDVGFSISGLPSDGVEVLHFVAARAIDFPDNFSGSVGHCSVNPTATASFDIKKNGSSIGSISIDNSGVFTFNTTGGAVALAVGDRLTVFAPSPQDATLADVGVLFAGTRTL
jgi:hypothetical protein